MMSDPFNKLIPRIEDAGKLDSDGNIIMNAGLKVVPHSYCGEFTDLFLKNRGVHEASQEYIFELVLNKIKENNQNKPIMIEFGSYWAYYSMWFQKVTNGVNYCVEPNIEHLELGRNNFSINNMSATFINRKVALWKNMNNNNLISIDRMAKLYKLKKIDLIHSDIQKAEVDLLKGGINSFTKQLIDYIFISTHSISIHQQCLDLINEYGYKIIANADENHTYFGDGLIVACKRDINFDFIDLNKTQE